MHTMSTLHAFRDSKVPSVASCMRRMLSWLVPSVTMYEKNTLGTLEGHELNTVSSAPDDYNLLLSTLRTIHITDYYRTISIVM